MCLQIIVLVAAAALFQQAPFLNGYKMPEKEVIVKCYDKSGTLLTTCSAISFDSDVVLMHGLLLYPIIKTELNKWFLSVLIGLQSEIRLNPIVDEKIDFIIHEEDSFLADRTCRSGRKMVSAGMWTCPLLKSTAKPYTGKYPILINSLSRGIVSQVFGRDDCMFLTDAAITKDSCGAPIFLAHNESSETVGKAALMGMTCTILEIDGVTQAISLLPVLKRLLPPGRDVKKYPIAVPRLHVRTLVDETIVIISCANSRGTGIVIDAASGIILTCHHCIPKGTSSIHVLHKSNIYPAKLVYKSVKFTLDIAVIQVSPGSFVAHMEFADIPPQIGERVHAAGFPGFSMKEGFYVKPFISVGHIAKCNPSSFIMTTCSIFPGQSGGAIMRNGKLLGIITSIIGGNKSSEKDKNDFSLGLAIPATVFAPYLKKFIGTENIKYLKNLESSAKEFPNHWPVLDSKM